MKFIHKAVNIVASLSFVVITLMVLYQIIMRFVFRIGVPWVEEVTRLLYIYLSFLGAAIALREKQLIVIETIPELLPARVKHALAVLCEIFCFIVIAMLLRGCFKMAGLVWNSPLATVDWISNGWMYTAGIVSFSYMLLIKIVELVTASFVKKNQATGE